MFPPLSATPLASTNPKPVISLTSLITCNFCPPALARTTVLVTSPSSSALAAGWAATATALGTCSSAASIPVNIECSKKIGVPEDVAETAITLGTSFHKDGSIIGSVFKIMFLVCLFGMNVSTGTGILGVLAIALISTLLVTAVPIGGGTISEMLIITMLGCPTAALPILTIIATIIDAPATMLNVVGDTASSMMISKIVDGKNWLKK